jgi:hypothetical protein
LATSLFYWLKFIGLTQLKLAMALTHQWAIKNHRWFFAKGGFVFFDR